MNYNRRRRLERFKLVLLYVCLIVPIISLIWLVIAAWNGWNHGWATVFTIAPGLLAIVLFGGGPCQWWTRRSGNPYYDYYVYKEILTKKD